MSDSPSFSKFVPGFDFLQGLVKNAGAALPGIGQWVAPTLNPEELGKRIEELRTVQFWLEQNARMLATTIQALEVQRMTLSTLQSMNVPLADLRDSLKLPQVPPVSLGTASAEPSPPSAASSAAPSAPTPRGSRSTAAKSKVATDESAVPPFAAVDPTQWWTSLSQQFTQLATSAMKDSATDAAKNLAGALVKQSFDAAGDTLRRAASVPGSVVGSVAKGLSAGAATASKARKAAAQSDIGSGATVSSTPASKTRSGARAKAASAPRGRRS